MNELKILLIEIRKGNTKPFYQSKLWRVKRKEILNRDNDECQRCKNGGGFSKANTVHHIEHLKDRIDLALEDNNLVSLCESCHNLEHPEKLEKMNENKINNNIITEEKW